jgi:hypothetical protein
MFEDLNELSQQVLARGALEKPNSVARIRPPLYTNLRAAGHSNLNVAAQNL